jgi:hypothetical protein
MLTAILLLTCLSTAYSHYIIDSKLLELLVNNAPEPHPRADVEPPVDAYHRSMAPYPEYPGSVDPAEARDADYDMPMHRNDEFYSHPHASGPRQIVYYFYYVPVVKNRKEPSKFYGHKKEEDKDSTKEVNYIPAGVNGVFTGPLMVNSVPYPLMPIPSNSIDSFMATRMRYPPMDHPYPYFYPPAPYF